MLGASVPGIKISATPDRRKSDEVGWTAYETCREKARLLRPVMNMLRTYLLSKYERKEITTTLEFTVSPGRTFAFVFRTWGIEIRKENEQAPWWASIYTATQGATFGVLFGTFKMIGPNFISKEYRGDDRPLWCAQGILKLRPGFKTNTV